MMNDERIRQTRSRIASRAFGIWYMLLLAALLVRQFYLGQEPWEYWDMALIFFLGSFYVSIAGFARGAVQENYLTRYWKWSVPAILLTILGLKFFQGKINTLTDVLVTLLAASLGVAVVGTVFFLLYRRWESKIDLEQ
jgi:hypothetical protein